MSLPLPRVKILFIAAIILLGLGIYLFAHRGEESTDDAAIDAHIVTISPKVSGYIKTSYIDDNKQVKTGDLLLEIDPADYLIKRDRAKAALESAQASYKAAKHNLDTVMISAPSSVEEAAAQLNGAKANLSKAESDLKRLQSLSNQARSREQLDAVIAAEKTARSAFEDAKARLNAAKTAPEAIELAKSNAEAAEGAVKQAKADLEQAEQDVSYTKIVAAQNGRITKRAVEQGDYVQAGQQLGFIVGSEIWVTANFKETQLKNIHAGDGAKIKIDAFPSLILSGKVQSFQAGTGTRFSAFPPENATGNFVKIVQRVPVKIILDSQPAATLPLGPGMSVTPTVYTR